MKTWMTLAFILAFGICFAQEPAKKEEAPIIVVDGVKYIRADSTHAFQNLNPEKIKAIKILKGQEAIDLYGEDGKYGVIVVTTKTSSTNTPLYILDGKTVEDISSINPNDIQSIEVIKDPVQLQPYGDEGKLGVVKITSKSKSRFR